MTRLSGTSAPSLRYDALRVRQGLTMVSAETDANNDSHLGSTCLYDVAHDQQWVNNCLVSRFPLSAPRDLKTEEASWMRGETFSRILK